MTPEQFCYWLQGFTELNRTLPDDAQWQAIKEHLEKVFFKVTPPVPWSLPVPTLPGFTKPSENILYC